MFPGTSSMEGFHAKKAGAVLYAYKSAKVGVHIADFSYYTEEVAVIMDNSEKIKFVSPITHVVYPNYKLTSCDPIAFYMYKTVEDICMNYGRGHSAARNPESLSVFSHLDFADNLPSLHTAGLFSYKNLHKMQEHAF